MPVELHPLKCFLCEDKPSDYQIAQVESSDEVKDLPGGLMIHSWVEYERLIPVCEDCWRELSAINIEVAENTGVCFALAPFIRSVI